MAPQRPHWVIVIREMAISISSQFSVKFVGGHRRAIIGVKVIRLCAGRKSRKRRKNDGRHRNSRQRHWFSPKRRGSWNLLRDELLVRGPAGMERQQRRRVFKRPECLSEMESKDDNHIFFGLGKLKQNICIKKELILHRKRIRCHEAFEFPKSI